MPELMLDRQPNFLQMALNEAHNIIFVKDNDFRIIYANKPFFDLFPPERRDSIIGTTTFENFLPAEVEAFTHEDLRALAGGETEIIEDITDYQGNIRTLLTRKIG